MNKQILFITFLLPSLLTAAAGTPILHFDHWRPVSARLASQDTLVAPGPTELAKGAVGLKQHILRTVAELARIRREQIQDVDVLMQQEPTYELANIRYDLHELTRQYIELSEHIRANNALETPQLKEILRTFSQELERVRGQNPFIL